MTKQEKSYTYFCAYMVFQGKEKFYSSRIHSFPQRLTTHKAIRAAERQIAKTIEGVDPKALRIVSLQGVGIESKTLQNDKEGKTHPYFVSYVAIVNGEPLIGNTVLDLEYEIQLQADIDAIEMMLREKNTGMKIEKLRILNFTAVGG